MDADVNDTVATRKVQKADREKLRRDRLNEQFLELGHALDPGRPKNDKATVLADTIQVLKDLAAQVDRLKAEYASLSEESNELTQEKTELQEETTALKSDIDNLNVQYQQRLRVMFPWNMDPSGIMVQPPYPYPLAVPIGPGPIPMHPSFQPFFVPNQNPGAFPNPCSAFLPYSSLGNLQVEQPMCLSHSNSRYSTEKQDFQSNAEKTDDSDDVATALELKTPGSSRTTSQLESVQEQELSEKQRRKQCSLPRKESGITDGSNLSRCSSSEIPQGSSSGSIGDRQVTKK